MDLETKLRSQSPEALAAVGGSVLEALRTNIPPLTDDEIDAAAAEDRMTVKSAAAEFNVGAASPSQSVDLAQVLLILANNDPAAKGTIEAAIERTGKPQAKLPILGLGGLELIALALAAAIARPSLQYERDAQGTTRLKMKVDGRNDLAKIIKAVLPSLTGSDGGQ